MTALYMQGGPPDRFPRNPLHSFFLERDGLQWGFQFTWSQVDTVRELLREFLSAHPEVRLRTLCGTNCWSAESWSHCAKQHVPTAADLEQVTKGKA